MTGMPGMQGLIDSRIREHMNAMAEQTALLQALLNQMASDPAQLCIGDSTSRLALTKDFPYEGATRAIIGRTPQAGNGINGAASGLLFDYEPNRLGGIIVNKSAANGVTLVLSGSQNSAAGQVWLAPNGGTWNFLLSGIVWCGSVFAVADSGNLSLASTSV
jgi:hypothetical protein